MKQTIFLKISRNAHRRNYRFDSDIAADYDVLRAKGRLTTDSFDGVSFKAKNDEDMKEQFLKIFRLGEYDCFECEIIDIDDLLETILSEDFRELEYYFVARVSYEVI